MSILQVPAYILALSYVASVVTSAIKPGIESVLPPANRWHDVLFTLLPLCLALGFTLGYALSYHQDVFMSIVWAALSWGAANGAYLLHTRTGGPADGTAGSSPAVPGAPRGPTSMVGQWPRSDPAQTPPATTGTVGPSVAMPPESPQSPPIAPAIMHPVASPASAIGTYVIMANPYAFRRTSGSPTS